MLAGAALIATLPPLMTQELCSVSFYFLTYSIYTVSIVIIIQIKIEFLANLSDLRSTVLKKMVLKSLSECTSSLRFCVFGTQT